MAELLKDIFSPSFYEGFCRDLRKVYPSFDNKGFMHTLFDSDWKNRELKQRMRHTSATLYNFLPVDFPRACEIFCDLIDHYHRNNRKEKSIEHFFIPDYIEQYGMSHYDVAVNTMEKITQFTSCEFAVRPFIIKYEDKMIQQMVRWSKHRHHLVRRLSSEGIRPRLPWAMALPELKRDPSPIHPILENLKEDESETVRRSVANNLNDISKDNPSFVLSLFKEWKNISPETDWIIKHGSRTLLKQGNQEILYHFGLHRNSFFELSAFTLTKSKIGMGDDLNFSFVITNSSRKEQKVRLEYGLYFRKANGQLSRKVFAIRQGVVPSVHSLTIHKKHSFRIITTRKYYGGEHKISVIVNGKEFGEQKFVLRV